jgi:hypothetical protein
VSAERGTKRGGDLARKRRARDVLHVARWSTVLSTTRVAL